MKFKSAVGKLSTIGTPKTLDGRTYYTSRDGWTAGFMRQGDNAICLMATNGKTGQRWFFKTMRALVDFVLSREAA